ncbi:hypothetical protein [Limosilactobacillus ingluviei]|uniref:Uncharacterized protein n=1 Tax=Limosilactobacillus ingluviei DSM 15946 TaxID=1423760 RepID=A0A0R1UPL9_9LACO|nr:hypothetical protein [Limosilactobacillus ingluviei]KRL91707.1 hypothetical protein FC43_GL001130 [Limosilactobacillus ingluviei DSM 15946]
MGTKRAIYWKAGNKVHFETDDKAVKIIDNNNNEIGTLKQLAFEGKPVSNISYRDIKRTGIYMVHGFNDRDLPTGVPNDKNCILSVTAVGSNPDNPDVIFYKIITPAGKTIENTVSGSAQSGWGEGGIDLRNTINTINNSIGRASDLGGVTIAQYAKDNRDKITSLDGREDSHYQEFKSHNHDDQYVKKSGDSMTGDLTFSGSGKTATISFDKVGKFTIGGDTQQTEIKGKGDLLYNGQRVVTTSKAGGTGIDADTLQGHHYYEFLDDGDILFSGFTMYKDTSFRADSGAGRITFNGSGDIVMNSVTTLGLASGAKLSGNMLQASVGEEVYTWNNNSGTMWIKKDPYVGEQGKRLFIRQGEPYGDIPEGSVWIGN